jgi:adenosylmethionine-8-amino-7-oxononanoate aminotransferase
MYGADTLRALHDLCRRHGVLFIADEVMTGWGRTGTRFACEQAGVEPDIVCLSKGLTGGFLPLAVTLSTEAIYRSFYSTDRAKTFFHSSSFTGNPLACAAACAALDLWQEEPVLERVHRVRDDLAALAPRLRTRSDVENLRQTGTIMAFDVHAATPGYLSDVAPKLYRHFVAQGVLLRPIGPSIYILPPYCTSQGDLEFIVGTIEGALDALRDGTLDPAS